MPSDPEGHLIRLELFEEERRKRRDSEAEAHAAKEREKARAAEIARRDSRPADYSPPSTPGELIERYRRGERYFAHADLRGARFPEQTFSNANFTGANFGGSSFSACIFQACLLEAADLRGATLEKAAFHLCNVDRMVLAEARLLDTRFSNLALGHVDFDQTRIEGLKIDNCEELPPSFASAKGIGTASFVGCTFVAPVLRNAFMAGAQFSSCSLASADLSGADLRETKFLDCTLTHAKFDGAQLGGTEFKGTRLASSSLKLARDVRSVDWQGVDISNCDLSQTDLHEMNFSGVKALETNFSQSKLAGADFSGAALNGASFKSAELRLARFTRAAINSADFEGADLRFVKDIRFDQNNLYSAKLSPKATDTWTELRRQYSGSRLAFHLVVLVAFFLPYVIRASAWVQVNNAQAAHAAAVERLRADPEKRRVLEAATFAFPEAMQIATSKCLAPECREWRVWELLLARDAVWYSQLLAWLLIVYNLARLYLTWKIGPLRDDEDRTYVTPALGDYQHLLVAHRMVQCVFYVSAVSFAFHVYDALILGSVWLPR
jgi:uncharacterized protein YjbI with pentapeptide repeats